MMKASFAMMTKVNSSFSPSKIILGNGAVSCAGEEAKKLGARKALIVTDAGVVEAGLTAGVEAALRAQKIAFGVYDRVEAEPRAHNVDECAQMVRAEGYDVLIGIGGGSSLDVAKGAAIVAANQGKALDYAGTDKVPAKGLPRILIATTAGTGSEVTRTYIVTDESDNIKKAIHSDFVLADVAIVDPHLTVSMPPSVTADTGLDALVHAVEAYVSVHATPFSDLAAIEAIGLIAEYLPVAYAKAGNMEARFNMSLAATLAGLAFTSGGLGAVHALSNPLGTEYRLSHGGTSTRAWHRPWERMSPGFRPPGLRRSWSARSSGCWRRWIYQPESVSTAFPERIFPSWWRGQ
jgi:alcohol dehydrogenase class IV